MIEGLQQLQGGSGGGEIWHRHQITFKSCDVSPLLHFTPFFPAVLDGDIEELQPNSEVLPA